MKRAFLVASGIALACYAAVLIAAVADHRNGTEVHFSPNGGCEAAVVAELSGAHKVHCLAYSFTSEPIATAIASVAKRGGEVVLVIDAGAAKSDDCEGHRVKRAGGKVLTDDRHAIAHNKVVLIDGHTLVNGSFNFTASAEHRNAENLLITRGNRELVKQYEADFQKHVEHSEKLK